MNTNNTHLDYCIDNVIAAYHRIGGRGVTAENLPARFTTLYTAIEALATEQINVKNTTPQHTNPPPCGGHICACTSHLGDHIHDDYCTCWNEYSLPHLDAVR